MRLIAVDTTSPRESVALLDGERTLGEVRLDGVASHSQHVLPAVAFLLQSAGIEARALDAFAVAIGPGSFTGLRVGIATVQGLALASGRPAVGVGALDALAAEAEGEGPLVAVREAYRDEVFLAAWDAGGRPLREAAVGALGALLEGVPAGARFVGDVAARREAIGAAAADPRFPSFPAYLAPTIGRLAQAALARGEGGPPEALRPLYLRPPAIRQAP